MRINALARSALINGGGIIELTFSPQKYAMELSSVAYDKLWRFDMEALPADLVRRGMAEEDPTAEHGLKLAIKDYPFANDGLLIWDAIKAWVQAYVARYYPDAASVAGDAELQAFWNEVRTIGHGDKKDAPWWPEMDTPDSLAQTLTTIIWVAAAHHAAVNFGQYDFGGYFPNRPSIARTNMPVEEPVDAAAFEKFLDNPDQALRECFPSQVQATLVMAVLDVLSSHSPDEEYLGGMETAPWGNDAAVQAAYLRFNEQLKELEGIIDGRNKDRKLKNRCGAGILPYQLMKPFSQPGVTGKGIPNSTSI
jgi:lipoxygenase